MGRRAGASPNKLTIVDLPEGLREFAESMVMTTMLNNAIIGGVLPEEARLNWKVPRT